MNARLPSASPAPPAAEPSAAAATSASAERLTADLCAALRARRAAGLCLPALESAIEALAALQQPGVAGLCAALQTLADADGDSNGDADDVATCQLAIIDALAGIGQDRPDLLAAAYAAHPVGPVADALCEAAGKVPGPEPTLLALMRRHLANNAFVAGLSLAAHGDAAALPALERQLTICLQTAWREKTGGPGEGLEQMTLHVEGLAEAITTLGGQLPQATADAVCTLQRANRAVFRPQ